MPFHCSTCGTFIDVADARDGGELTCSSCGSRIRALSTPTLPWKAASGQPAESVDAHGLETVPYPGCATEPAADLPPQLGRYRIEEEIARGGMGRIVRVHDQDFQRTLAMKVLLGPSLLSGAGAGGWESEIADRLLREARLTGQLQHPGIPPVQEMGRLPDGRPYFIMKLVQGSSLKALLQTRSSLADDLPRFVAIFEQICQTVAYAHSQGVIHRDLKPSNVMVGAFGEVQVMDWGLAKEMRMAECGSRNEPTGPSDQTATHETRAGQVMGTPAFMAPEQARGEIDNLDARCDVFGLGGILCEILTGTPPFAAKNASDSYEMASRGDLSEASARLEHSGTDAELVVLAKKCLAPAREDRPNDAGAVAEAVGRYQAELQRRLKQAQIDRAAAEVKAREERKRRRVWLALAAALLLFLVSAAGVGLWYVNDRAQRQVEENARQAELEVRRKQLNRDANAAGAESLAMLKDLRLRLDDPGKVRGLLSAIGEWKGIVDRAGQTRARALAAVGGQEALLEPGTLESLQALATHLKVEDESYRLAKELDEIRLKSVTQVVSKFDPASAGPEYAGLFARLGVDIAGGDPDAAATLVTRSPIRHALVAALDDWARVSQLQNSKHLNLLPKLLEIARRADPDPWRDRFRQVQAWTNPETLKVLATQIDSPHQSPQMIVCFAHELRRHEDSVPLLRSALVYHPSDFWLHFELGNRAKEPGERAAHFQAALAIRPESSAVYNNLGVVLRDQKNLPGAIAACRKAIELDPRLGWAYDNLGLALHDQNDLPGAIAALKKAVELDPNDAVGYHHLGNALKAHADVPGAVAAYQKAVNLDPKLAENYYSLGIALRAQNNLSGAVAAYQKTIDLDAKHAKAHNNLGAVLLIQRNLSGAMAAFKKAIDLDPNLTEAHNNLGMTLRAQNDVSGAIDAYRRAIAADPKNASAHQNLGHALLDRNDFAGAMAAFKKTIDLDPAAPASAYFGLGNAFGAQKELSRAVAAFNKAIALAPEYAEAHCNLGHALKEQGDFAAALVAMQRGHQLGTSQQSWRYASAAWVQHCEQLLGQERRLLLILEKKEAAPPGELLSLAQMCQVYKKRYALAVRLYQQAFEAQPTLATDHFAAVRAAALGSAGQDVDNPNAVERAALRQLALVWLKKDFEMFTKAAKKPAGKAEIIRILHGERYLVRAKVDPHLASLRDDQELAKLSPEDETSCRALWQSADELLTRLRALFTSATSKGVLGAKERQYVKEIKLQAGQTLVIEMQSAAFDTFLRLEDSARKVLAENDDIVSGNTNSRVIFTVPEDGAYRIVATSFEERGVGAYTLTIRDFAANTR